MCCCVFSPFFHGVCIFIIQSLEWCLIFEVPTICNCGRKGCSIFDCIGWGERIFFWPPYPHIFFLSFGPAITPPPHFFLHNHVKNGKISDFWLHPHIFFTFFSNLSNPFPPYDNQKWNRPNGNMVKSGWLTDWLTHCLTDITTSNGWEMPPKNCRPYLGMAPN